MIISPTDPSEFWSVDAVRGMLPACPARLVGAVPEAIVRLDEIAAALPHTSREVLQRAIIDLGVPDLASPMSPASSEAALRAYSFVAARCIHENLLGPGRKLGRAVAEPLWALATLVGRPPGLTYASYILANCSELPAARSQPDTLLVLRTFSGTSDEAWFIAAHLAIESIGGEIVSAIERMNHASPAADEQGVIDGLEVIADAINWATTVLGRIREGIDPELFRTMVRPNLFGFANVTFELSPPLSVSYVGETGAQAGVMQAIDLVLAVDHAPPMEKALARFRDCAPPPHQEYMTVARNTGRAMADRASSCGAVRQTYIAALTGLHQFRETHASIVEEYLFADTPGTGGTTGHPWLRALCEDVSRTARSYS